jgi:hypothetical protein
MHRLVYDTLGLYGLIATTGQVKWKGTWGGGGGNIRILYLRLHNVFLLEEAWN